MTAKPQQVSDGLIGLMREGSLLATPEERRTALLYVVLIVGSGVLDVVALGLIMPFVALLIDPTILDHFPPLAAVYEAVGKPPVDALILVTAGACLALITFASLFSFVLQRAVNRFVARCKARLAKQLFDEIVRAPLAWHLRRNSAITAHGLQRDVLVWANEFLLKALGVVRDLVMVILPAALVVFTTPLAGLVALATIGALVVVLLRMARPRIEGMTQYKNLHGDTAQLIATQGLVGVREVKVSGREESFVNAFGKAFTNVGHAQAVILSWYQLPATAIIMAGQIALFAVALALWWVRTDPAILAAQLALLVMVTSRVLPAANRLAGAVSTLYSVTPAIRSIIQLRRELNTTIGAPTVPKVDVPRPWKTLKIDKLGFSYPDPTGTVAAVDDVSMTLQAGMAYGVVGSSGAGKSTLVDLIIGLLTPTSGRILIDGLALDASTATSWLRRVGYVSQMPFVSDDTLRANIAFGVEPSRVDDARLTDVISIAGLTDLLADLPEGKDTRLGERGTRLSGGQRQRVAIARAVYDDVDLLVLDEATSALDAVTEREVQAAIDRLKGRVTTITIAHRLSTVRNTDRIFMLDRGRLIASGSWDELIASSTAFRRLVEADGRGKAA